MSNTPSLTLEDVRGVAPALAHYTETAIIRDLWARSGLSARDRSLVTVSALVAGERTIGFAHYFTRALDGGVTPGELSELITHVAFYAGWSTAFNAVVSLKGIFAQRGVSADQLPPVSPDLLSVDEALPGMRPELPCFRSVSGRLRRALSRLRTICCMETCGCVLA